MSQTPWYNPSPAPHKRATGVRNKAECCILFAYHKNNALTHKHLNIVKQANPGYPVIPIHRDQEHMPGAVNCQSPEWINEDVYYGADIQYYNWFKKRTLEAERYVWMEYDTLATMPLKQYFGSVWNSDAVSAGVQISGQNDWYWWRDLLKLPQHLRPYAAGMTPLAMIMLSHKAMQKVSYVVQPPGVHCELRVGTLLRAAGITLTKHPAYNTITHDPKFLTTDFSKPGVYHPVKK